VVKAYLDHASTTPVNPAALAAMLPLLTEHYGNPSAANAPGRRARRVLDEAREEVAVGLGCAPGEVVFCSGGTEAANMAVFGTVAAAGTPAGRMICSAVEHPAVLKAVMSAGGSTVGVGYDGVIDLDALGSALGADVSLVAVMLANNEVGTIQPIQKVAGLVRERSPGAVLLVDAVHAAASLDVAELCSEADMVFVSAHKFGGPKGSGALVVRTGTRWVPVGRGGAQERERRPGTENVAGIAGMAAGLTAAVSERADATARVGDLRDRLAESLCSSSHSITETGARRAADGRVDRSGKVAGSCHLTISGVEQEELLFMLDSEGVYASAGSACASGAAEPSHVLEAMGVDLSRPQAAALRLSLGPTTSDAEIDHAVGVIPKIVEHLRAGN